jgi:hypothetical protein
MNKLPERHEYSHRRSLPEWIVTKVIAAPRPARIGLVAVFALAVTLALSPLVDYLYDLYFFSPETVILPALVTTAFGLSVYAVGWWYVVGTIGEKPVRRKGMLVYLAIGVAAVVLVAALLISGISLLNFGD